MNITVNEVRSGSNFARVPDADIPRPEVYRQKGTKNFVYIAKNRLGEEVVLDHYVVLKDVDGYLTFCERQTVPFWKKFTSVFEAAASVLIFWTDPRLRGILSMLGISTGKVDDVMARLKKIADKDRLNELVELMGNEKLTEVHKAIKGALEDNIFTQEEYTEIQRLVAKHFNDQTKVDASDGEE